MRLTRIHVLIIGLLVVVGLAIAFGIAYARPQLKKLSDTEQQVETQRGVAETMLSELQELATAQADLELKDQQTYAYMVRMPQIDTNQYQAMIDLWKEYSSVLGGGPMMARYVASQHGVQPIAFSLPSAPITPLSSQPPVILVPVNDFAVRADDLPSLIAFLRAISKAPRMASISNVTINGTSPMLIASMPLSVYLVTRWALPGPGIPPTSGGGPAAAEPGAPAAPTPAAPPPAEAEQKGRE